MAKNKRRLKKIFIFLILIIILSVIGVIGYFLLPKEIKNIYIHNNVILNDQEIIELAEIDDYPNFYTTTAFNIKKKIKANEYIKDVVVKKVIFNQLHIYITEYKPLFIKADNNTLILENKKEIATQDNFFDLPVLINEIPENKFSDLIDKYLDIDDAVVSKISEIKYDPNDVDEDRFLLYMNDKNYVYVTLTKFYLLNKYNEAIEKLDGKNGILYLDSGNYFEVKKN